MRAWQVHELGDPIDRMVLDEIDDPDVGPGRVVVDVEAVGLAFPDVLQCRGEYQVKPPLPFTPGSETAGRVSAVGDDVDSAILGRRVVALGGGLAERLVLPASSVFEVPDVLASTKAAAVPMNYGTTWFALHNRAGLAEGEVDAGHSLHCSCARRRLDLRRCCTARAAYWLGELVRCSQSWRAP